MCTFPEGLARVHAYVEFHPPLDGVQDVILLALQVFHHQKGVELLPPVDVGEPGSLVELRVRNVPGNLREEVIIHLYTDGLGFTGWAPHSLKLQFRAIPGILLAIGVSDHLVLPRHNLREFPAGAMKYIEENK